MTEIVKVEESHKADYMALFLLADPSEKMVNLPFGRLPGRLRAYT